MRNHLTLVDTSIDNLLYVFSFLEKTSGIGHSIHGEDAIGQHFKIPFQHHEIITRDRIENLFNGSSLEGPLKISVVKD